MEREPTLNATVSAISPGPYQWGIIKEGPTQEKWVLGNLAFGSGDIHCVFLPNHPLSRIGADPEAPEHCVMLCMTGNGPKSRDNALALMEMLNAREKLKGRKPLPIPSTPEAVAWAERAIELENALGIGYELPDSLKMTPALLERLTSSTTGESGGEGKA